MTKKEIKKLCNELIIDIECIQKNPVARNQIHPSGFLNLCHFKTKLQGYVESNQFPSEIDIPPYDLSALEDNEFFTDEFIHLHKKKADGEVILDEEIIQIISANA